MVLEGCKHSERLTQGFEDNKTSNLGHAVMTGSTLEQGQPQKCLSTAGETRSTTTWCGIHAVTPGNRSCWSRSAASSHERKYR